MENTIHSSLSSPDDCLPPEGWYPSREALLKSVNAWAATRGYAFTTGKSTTTPSGRMKVTYACDRVSKPPDPSVQRHRKTSTRGTGCPFSVLAKEAVDKSGWELKHRPDHRFTIHNHPPSAHPVAHPAHRGQSMQEVMDIDKLIGAGVTTKNIQTYARQQDSCSLITAQDIRNRIAEMQRQSCEGESTIHALANQLDREGFWSRIQFDDKGRVTAVLFAHPGSLGFLQSYPDVLILDCTYKTNKYRMPLLEIIGVDACQRSFCVAFAFISGEETQDYLWVFERLRSLYETCNARLPSVIVTDGDKACMNAIRMVFPSAASILCLWHANKAVQRNCKSTFQPKEHEQCVQ